jgi:hypothetical protein
LPKDNVEGVSGVWANPDEPKTRRESKRTVAPRKCLLPHFAGLELKLGK